VAKPLTDYRPFQRHVSLWLNYSPDDGVVVAEPHRLIGPARDLSSLLACYGQSARRRRVMWLNYTGWLAQLGTSGITPGWTSARVQQDQK